jgi:hypothetical protein
VYEADQAFLRVKQPATATTISLANEEFSGALSFIFPHLDENTRTLRVRFEMPNPDHKLRPGMYATVKIKVLPRQIDLFTKAFGTSTEPQAQLKENRVLAVPDSAVIDTGNLKIVYREASPDTYEGVIVQLAPRMALADQSVALYPVLSGLKAGDRVVTNGSFLIDAETRLNPSGGSIYFGGSGSKGGQSNISVRPSTPEDADNIEMKVKSELARLSAEDRRLAEAQRYCPIQPANRLGEMGTPFKLALKGQPVFLCCEGCADQAKQDETLTLTKVSELRAKVKAGTPKK